MGTKHFAHVYKTNPEELLEPAAYLLYFSITLFGFFQAISID